MSQSPSVPLIAATRALMAHIEAHGLPFSSIRVYALDAEVSVQVYGGDYSAWIESLASDWAASYGEATVETAEQVKGKRRVDQDITIGGHRVHLVTFLPVEALFGKAVA